MDKKQLFDTILMEAVDSAKYNFPDKFEHKNFGEEFAFSAFNTLGANMSRNSVISLNPDVSPERRNAARASAFILSVVNSVYITDKIHDGIDEYIKDPQNKDKFKGMSEQEIQTLKTELKDYVTDTLSVKAKTEEGKKFVKDVTEKYNTIVKYKDDPGMRSAIEKEGIFEENSNDLIMGGTLLVCTLNNWMHDDYPVSQTINEIKERINETNPYESMIVDALENNSAALASEEEYYTQTVKNLTVSVGDDQPVKPTEFLEHYENNQLSADEIIWARNVFDSGMTDKSMDFSSYMLDGKPMFSKEKIENTLPAQLKTEVVAAALSGKEVAIKDNEKEKLTLLTPKITETAAKTPKSFWQKIMDFFSNLLKDKSKEKAMQEKISTTLKDFNNKDKLKEKISFNELSGRNTLGKLTTPPSRQNDLSKAKSGPSK